MPISARMSLWGLYKYDNTILDNLSVPTGMDSNNLKQNLLVETSSLSVLYPDPDFMKTVIGLWSAERADVWNKLYATTQLTYNPIENYDRIEETEESSAGVSVRDASHSKINSMAETSSDISVKDNNQSRNTEISESAAQNNSERVSETIGKDGTTSNSRNQSGSSTATNSNTAYNSATFADTAQTVSSGEDQVTDVGTAQENTDRSSSNEARSDSVRTSSGNETMSGNDRESRNGMTETSGNESLSENGRESRNDNRRVTSRIHGNIGVTTSQQMIEAQREVVQFCMTEFIINEFIQRFCVMVY